ncbi:MAG: hypothetical protein KKB50_08145 [Planctomycetes bacterium]|nr:hypothetical protein [Planctomycetota bacterium]
MKRTLRIMFLVVELNLVFWLVIWAMTHGSLASMKSVNTIAFVGLAFAAIVQHWAYYAVYKEAKQMQPQ